MGPEVVFLVAYVAFVLFVVVTFFRIAYDVRAIRQMLQSMGLFSGIPCRPCRMRRTAALRALVRETELTPRHLIAPLFVKEGISEPVAIGSMPGQLQHTLESLRKEAAEIASRGVLAFML